MSNNDPVVQAPQLSLVTVSGRLLPTFGPESCEGDQWPMQSPVKPYIGLDWIDLRLRA
jgi:hypothetical protein